MRKNRLLLFILVLLFSFTNQRSSFYQTECVSIETDGYITIKIWNTQKGQGYKPEQARKEAIHAILFSGIAGSSNGCTTQPPILNKLEEQEAFKRIEVGLLGKNGKWSIFTRSASTQTILPGYIGDKNWKVYRVSISKKELRKYLEEQKIIKSLSNGF